MVEQVTFQTIFQLLQTIGILVGVFYYIMTIRTNQRNQELTLETRQLQLYMKVLARAVPARVDVCALLKEASH